MPYIKPINRIEMLNLPRGPQEVGEYNYLLTDLCNYYLKRNGLCYKSINDLIGVLECAKLELYRKLSWYEDMKARDSGEVLDKEFLKEEH